MQKSTHKAQAELLLPSDISIQKIATSLEKQIKEKCNAKRYASIKEVLSLIGKGAAIASVILAPGTAKAFASLLKQSPDYEEWKHFNPSYLRRTLRQLHKQKHIELVYEKGEEVIKLTQGGKRRILHYSIQTLAINKPNRWDGLWRMVMYDIPKEKHKTSDYFRLTLQNLGFYPIQKSVYLFPYPCFDEIEYLRQFYFLDITVQYLLVKSIENDGIYRTYFSLE